MIRLEPIFLDDNPDQGVINWKIIIHSVPELVGTPKQVKWARTIRISALHAFIDGMIRQGGDYALANRHWWTDELRQDVADVQDALNAELVPLIESAEHSLDWIHALDYDRNANDAGVIVRLLQKDKRK